MHEDHRQRLKNRFLKDGLDSFEGHNVLELLLFFSVPRRDTNPIAHELMNAFGSLAKVMDAPFEELVKVRGVTAHTAALIKLIPELSRRYLDSRDAVGSVLADTTSAGRYILPKFVGRRDEAVLLICLDNKRKVLDCSIIFEGSVNSAQISIRKILEYVLRFNATSVIISHNHPGGIAIPSKEDLATTQKIRAALDTIHVTVLDHIIVAENDYVSLADSGFFDKSRR